MPLILPLCTTLLAHVYLRASSTELLLLLRKCHWGAEAVSNFTAALVEQQPGAAVKKTATAIHWLTSLLRLTKKLSISVFQAVCVCTAGTKSNEPEGRCQTLCLGSPFEPLTFPLPQVPPENSSLTNPCIKLQVNNSPVGWELSRNGMHRGCSAGRSQLQHCASVASSIQTPNAREGFYGSELSLCRRVTLPHKSMTSSLELESPVMWY